MSSEVCTARGCVADGCTVAMAATAHAGCRFGRIRPSGRGVFLNKHLFERATYRIDASRSGDLAWTKSRKAQLWFRVGQGGRSMVRVLHAHGYSEGVA